MNEAYEKKLVSDFAGGTHHERITTVVETTRRYVLFKIAGHNYWSGVGFPWRYAQQEHVLIRKGIHGSGKGKRWAGRLTKALRSEITQALLAAERDSA